MKDDEMMQVQANGVCLCPNVSACPDLRRTEWRKW